MRSILLWRAKLHFLSRIRHRLFLRLFCKLRLSSVLHGSSPPQSRLYPQVCWLLKEETCFSACLYILTQPTIAAPTTTSTLTPSSYKELGCITDAWNRTLSGSSTIDQGMTTLSCAIFCEGFVYFGTEYGTHLPSFQGYLHIF